REDRVRRFRIRHQEAHDRVARGLLVERVEELFFPRRRHHSVPRIALGARQIEHQLEAHVEDARDVLRALDVPAHPVDRIGHTAQHRSTSGSARTHVSLLPPPCDEFTTNDPFFSATRVSPPGKTKMSSPYRMYGRRSTWRPSSASPTSVGTRESARSG